MTTLLRDSFASGLRGAAALLGGGSLLGGGLLDDLLGWLLGGLFGDLLWSCLLHGLFGSFLYNLGYIKEGSCEQFRDIMMHLGLEDLSRKVHLPI